MIQFNLSDIAPILNAEITGADDTIRSVTTDSRFAHSRDGCLFIALQGKKFDAHNFAAQAVSAGATALLVSKRLPLKVPQLIVADTRRALGILGTWVRQQVPARVVAITGSAGKTSVKEMTAAILRQCGYVLATEGNLNNDIGVSLTLLRLTREHDFAVIELGANNYGDLAWTTDLVRPETALINNISAAHLDGFGSISGVIKAKGEIFERLPDNSRGIVNADSYDWSYWKQLLGNKAIWRFAVHPSYDVDFYATNIITNNQGVEFIMHCPTGKCIVQLPLPGMHNIANALAASALAISVGVPLSAVHDGLKQIRAIPGRLFPIFLGFGHLLIDDSYNANVSSMIVAAQVLSKMPGYRVMVVGDLAELKNKAVAYHQQVGDAIAIYKINKVLSIGQLSYLISSASGKKGEHFQDNISLISRILQLLSKHTVITILVKGSRNAHMEQIVLSVKEKALC